MMNKITFTEQEKKFLKAHYFSKKFLSKCANDLESSITRIVKAYNKMDWGFEYQTITKSDCSICITYNFYYNCRKQADFVSVDINITDYICLDLIKNKRISNKYDLYEITAKVCDFIRKELNYEKQQNRAGEQNNELTNKSE